MKSALLSLFLALGALAQQLTINTPANAVVCEPLLITFSGGTGPYRVTVLPGNQPGAPALVDLGSQTGNQVSWQVNQPAGTSIGLTLRDSTGNIAQSAPFTINPGSDTSCVGQNPSFSPSGSGGAAPTTGGATSASGAAPTGSTSAAAPTATSPAATTPPAASSPAATSRPATTSASRPSGSATSAGASSTTNAASANLAQAGFAGVIGAALVAVLA